MSQFHTQRSHFSRQMVTKDYDGCFNTFDGNLDDRAWYIGHTSMCQFHTEWSHFSRQMVTIDYDGVSTHLMIILMIELGI